MQTGYQWPSESVTMYDDLATNLNIVQGCYGHLNEQCKTPKNNIEYNVEWPICNCLIMVRTSNT